MKLFKYLGLVLTILFSGWMMTHVSATITVPNVFVPFTTISSSSMNTNFSTIAEAALDRHGDNIDGNITVTNGITIDGADISAYLAGGKVTASSTAADALKAAGGITAGSGNVGIVDTTGKIPALSSTYFASLSGANLTSIPPGALTVAPQCAWNVVAKSAIYSAAFCDLVEITSGTFTITLPAASGATSTSYKVGVKNDAGTVCTIARTGSDTIDGATSFSCAGIANESYDFVVNAAKTGWMVR